MDIWKGNFRGESVCIKVVRGQKQICLWEIKEVRRLFYSAGLGDALSSLRTRCSAV